MPLSDKIIALICLAAFFSFLLLSVAYIREFDLFMVCSVTLALAAYDFWLALFRSDAEKNGSS